MFIFYLALIILLFGFLFIIYSFSVRKEGNENNKFLDGDLDRYRVHSSDFSEVEDPYLEDIRSDSYVSDDHVFTETATEEKLPLFRDDRVASELANTGQERTYVVTIFEDKGNTVRLGKKIADDRSFNELKRVGAGTFSIKQNSFDLVIDSKYFRFDFHHINKIEGIDNSILLFIDTLKFPYLIISDTYDFSSVTQNKFKGS